MPFASRIIIMSESDITIVESSNPEVEIGPHTSSMAQHRSIPSSSHGRAHQPKLSIQIDNDVLMIL